MKNTFLNDSMQALRELKRAQEQRGRMQARAQMAFDRARDDYRSQLKVAAGVEGAAWSRLLTVQGMTLGTAAALCDVSVATVHRRVKGAGDER